MSVCQPADQQLSDEDRLIQAAIHDRERQRSGVAMRAQILAVLVLAAAGCWLVLVLAGVPFVGYIGIGLGVVVFAISGLFLLGAIDLSPVLPWGSAARGRCPQCGERTLREDRALHWEVPGSGRPSVHGIVTLCTPECGYATARDVKVWLGRP